MRNKFNKSVSKLPTPVMTKETRERLSKKSLEIFGASSRFQTMLRRGRRVDQTTTHFYRGQAVEGTDFIQKQTEAITVQQIEDTLDHLIKIKKEAEDAARDNEHRRIQERMRSDNGERIDEGGEVSSGEESREEK